MNPPNRYLANVLAFGRVVIVGVIVCICHHATLSDGKVFERCELAQLLRYGHGLDVNDVANWVCIAQHSSSLNSSAFGGDTRSGSHGLFQISDQYWCSPPGKGVACGVTCDKLRDDDIGDDLECIRIIYQEHQRLSGDGYNAWNAYQPYCRENPYEYVEDCFGNEERVYLYSKSITANYVEDDEEEEDSSYSSKKRGKVYGRCELAKELFLKHKMLMEEIPTWVCIAQHESNYDTSAVGRLNADGSADHGLFQISDLYWCSHKGGRRKACGLPCSKLLDSDITDDVKCVKQIYKEHTRISGDGFTAWTVYNAYCHGKTVNYIRGCFDGINVEDSDALEEYRKPPKPSRVDKQQKPHGKVYEPCELADELRSKHHLPEDQIATWVCIAKHESDYNTSAIGYGDHGLFQISDIYWCSPPGKGWACGLSCADLEDSDISDDVECIRKIYAEHTQLSGDGFNAWSVYPHYCSEGRSEKYISQCPGIHPRPAVTAPPYGHSKLTNPNSIEDENYQPKRGKIYGRCELAKELLTKHEMSMDMIPTWVCIAHHESNFDTSAVGRRNTDGSADHGLFQISDLYWCSHKDDYGKACGLQCSKLLDNDITDDIKCIKKIHNEHTRISGDGFTAWTVYDAYCRERTEQYIRGCFDGSAPVEDFKPQQRAIDYGYIPKNKPKGKVYEECELANELRDKYHIPKEQISTWVCIAKHQSGLNTSSSVSDVHGMFHISDEYWCSPPGKGKVCELACSDLEDSDISDDVDCIRKIYLEHQRLFGNGFSAWVVYPQHCSNGRADDYVGHCFGFESPRKNVITTATPKLINRPNRPVYNHMHSENPFLRHIQVVNSDAALSIFSNPIEESFSASDEVDTIVPANHEYSLNPFLKNIKPVQENQPEVPIKTITSLPVSLGSIPIAPTPTKITRLQTYQPQNEEQAKYEAFKALATPSLPFTTQTPRANRLQTYQLNTFKTFATPTMPVTINRLQPYQLNTFNSFKTTATPTTQPFSTEILSIKQQPTVQPKTSTFTFKSLTPQTAVQTRPSTSTRTPLVHVSKDSGRYDSGRYDSRRYDAGRYDPARYSQPSRATINTNSKPETKSYAVSLGQYPTPTFQSKSPSSIRITSTTLSSSKPFDLSIQKTDQLTNTKFPSISTNFRRYEPFKTIATPTLTTKTPTLKPTTTTVTSPKKFEAYKAVNSGKYIPYKPPSGSKDSGKYIPNKSSLSTTTSSTTKFDPFKPFGSGSTSYNPFKAFNAGQTQSSTFSFLSAKPTSSNELDFEPSSNSKRETETFQSQFLPSGSSTRDLRTSKRETKSAQKPAVITSVQQQKDIISSSIEQQIAGTPLSVSAKSPTQTRSVNTIEVGKSTSIATSERAIPAAKTSSARSTTQTKSGKTIEVVKSTSTIGSETATTVGSVGQTKSENMIGVAKPTSTTATPIRSTATASSYISTTQTRSLNAIRLTKLTLNAISKTTSPTRSITKSTPTLTTKQSRHVAGQLSTKPTRSSDRSSESVSITSTVTTKPSRSVASQLSATPRRSSERSSRSVSTTSTVTTKISATPTRSSESSSKSISTTATVTTKLSRPIASQLSSTPTRSSESSSGSLSATSAVTTKPSHPIASQLSATPTRSSERSSRSVTTTGTSSSTTSIKSTSASSRQFTTTTTTRSTESSSSAGSIKTSAVVKPGFIVTSKPTVSTYREYTATSTSTSDASAPSSSATRSPTESVSTSTSMLDASAQISLPTGSISAPTPASDASVSSSSAKRSPTGSISTPTPASDATVSSSSATRSPTESISTSTPTTGSPTRSINTSPTAKPASIVTSKPTLRTYRQYSATTTRSVARSSPTRLTASSTQRLPKTTATVASLVPTRTGSQRPLIPSKVTTTSTRPPSRSTTTKNKRPFTTTSVISPTKPHRSSESLYSSRLNIYDLYYKLYGVHPPIRTSSGVDQVTKSSQTNVVPSRTS